MINFDSYAASAIDTAKSVSLECRSPHISKGLDFFKRLKRKGFKGFTLAETLITLTIIGVIAALTVPTLISKYQKYTYVVGLKKAYAQLQNAMKMMPTSEGCSAGDYECVGITNNDGSITIEGFKIPGFEESQIIKHIAKQFKTVKGVFEKDNHDEDCLHISNVFGDSGRHQCFITSDGMFIGHCSTGICVDVNGRKGPNKVGRDIFKFTRITKDGYIIPAGSKLDYDGYWRDRPNLCTTESIKANKPGTEICTGRVLEEDAMNY